MLDEKMLKSWVNDITYKRAKQYYEGGYVEELKIDTEKVPGPGKKSITVIKSRVISFNGFNSYDTQIEFDNFSGQMRGNCTCLDRDGSDEEGGYGPCKHITAMLIKYVREYQGRQSDGRHSVNEIDSLIDKLKHASEEGSEYRRELNLEIKFSDGDYYHKPNIELKLGLEKSYVVKSMRKFLDAVLKGESLEFGKNFTYDPSIHKFNITDEKIMQMLVELRELEGEHHNNFGYYNYYDNSIFSGKKLTLTDKLIYRFFRLAKGRCIDAVIHEQEYKNVNILETEMPLKFRLGMNRQTIELSQESDIPEPVDGFNRVYFYEGNFYLPPEKQIRMYEPIYDLLKIKRNSKLIISRSDGEKVASFLLPALKKVTKEITLDKNVQEAFYEAELTIRTYLDKVDDVVTAAVKYVYDDVEIDPFKNDALSRNKGILIRDVEKEENCDRILRSFGFEKDKEFYVMKDEGNVVSFIDGGVSRLQELGEVYYSESFRSIRLYGKNNIISGVKLGNGNFLEFSFQLEGVDRDELKDIFNALREKKKYYKLKKGGFVSLEDEGIKDAAELIDYLGINDKELSNEKILISKYNALYMDQKIKDKNLDFIKRSSDFREIVNNIHDIKEMDYELPEHLNKVMRNYQKIGFKWFKTLAHYGFGGILADEMGLGKTLEAIAFIASERGDKPSLVVAPTSLLYNWQSEIERFAPELKSLVMSGSKSQREELMDEIKKNDIIITSYPLIRRDIDEYKDIDFKYCILDEAQQIKNAASISANSVKQIKAEGYFALTGTPMENSLMELWSIFDFIMPGYLFTHNKFSRVYETPIVKGDDKNAAEELNRHIKPFILRRLKKDVLKELPPKIEHKLIVEMTEEQKKLYAAYSEHAKQEIGRTLRDKGFSRSKIQIFAILTRLRQICCDPSIFVEDFKGESGKMQALSELLDESISQGHKVLLFSQFTSVLKNIAKMLNNSDMKYLYLDGSTKSEERMALCREFNTGDANIFLISLKAGGTGLNLTGADTVIHFDPWWNPAVEEQATDRAHRIGQEKNVEVIKLLSKGTIEEKIYDLQEKKKKIINNVINENMNEDNVMTQMTQDDLESLFS